MFSFLPHLQKETVMSTQQVADDIVAMWRKGQFNETGEKYWADNVVSREPGTGDMAVVQGKAAAHGKGEWWEANHEVHGVTVEGPWVNGDEFAVRLGMDVTFKPEGRRFKMEEIALYTVKDDKIAEERFFYTPQAQA
jgi:ketosteroid isomerase-like protein